MKERKKKTYPGLRAEMSRNGDTQPILAKELNIALSTFWSKISGRNDWTISEIEFLCKRYNKDYYELFK